MLIVSLIAAFFSLFPHSMTGSAVERQGVHCDIRLTAVALKPGGTYQMEIRFSPEDGVHVNSDSPIDIEFEELSPLRYAGPLSMRKIPTTEFVDTRHPLTANVAVIKKCKSGKHTVKGSLRFTFSSDAEGWSSRYTQPFELTFTVSP